MTRLKVFTDASPKKIEDLFNEWASPAEIDVLTTQLEYSPALQKFILCATYTIGEPQCLMEEGQQESKKNPPGKS